MELVKIYNNSLDYINKEVEIKGWIRNHRKQKDFGFIDFSDGTCFKHIQVVYDKKLSNFNEIMSFNNGSSIKIKGDFIKSLNDLQDFEIQASEITLEGDCPEDYPLQPKKHSREFLREIGYLRPRTNLFQAVFRIRSITAHAIHTYFQELGYVYLHAPLITASDCEGAGEMFQVTTLDIENLKGKPNYKEDFFGKKASLTVSGQLQGEIFAMAFKKIYTFGPTFRAENSNTKTHASEFWMIEPEIAFCDLNSLMDVEEDMLKFIVNYVLKNAREEIEFLNKFVDDKLIERLNKLVNSKFTKIKFEEAIDLLKKSADIFENEPKHNEDIAKEHEKWLTNYFDGPVFLTDWPKNIKSFYMKQNSDNKTVAAVDLLVPGAGELMGGSQREENYEKLLNRMIELNMNPAEMDWYLNLRKYGGCIHSGFGMGFERLLIYLTGVENIRDVIPFPRTPKTCEF